MIGIKAVVLIGQFYYILSDRRQGLFRVATDGSSGAPAKILEINVTSFLKRVSMIRSTQNPSELLILSKANNGANVLIRYNTETKESISTYIPRREGFFNDKLIGFQPTRDDKQILVLHKMYIEWCSMNPENESLMTVKSATDLLGVIVKFYALNETGSTLVLAVANQLDQKERRKHPLLRSGKFVDRTQYCAHQMQMIKKDFSSGMRWGVKHCYELVVFDVDMARKKLFLKHYIPFGEGTSLGLDLKLLSCPRASWTVIVLFTKNGLFRLFYDEGRVKLIRSEWREYRKLNEQDRSVSWESCSAAGDGSEANFVYFVGKGLELCRLTSSIR